MVKCISLNAIVVKSLTLSFPRLNIRPNWVLEDRAIYTWEP